MLIGFGGKKGPGDIVDLLLDCHVRIRSFSALALRIAEAEGVPPAEIADAAAKVRRYFTVALPKHVEDEEESVLPRLMGKDPALDAALQKMEAEHEGHEAPLRRVVAISESLAADPEQHAALRRELQEVARQLVDEFEVHLKAEEEVILPAIRAHLSEEVREEMVAELRHRRADLT